MTLARRLGPVDDSPQIQAVAVSVNGRRRVRPRDRSLGSANSMEK